MKKAGSKYYKIGPTFELTSLTGPRFIPWDFFSDLPRFACPDRFFSRVKNRIQLIFVDRQNAFCRHYQEMGIFP